MCTVLFFRSTIIGHNQSFYQWVLSENIKLHQQWSTKMIYNWKGRVPLFHRGIHKLTYNKAFFVNVLSKILDPSLNAWEGFKYYTNYLQKEIDYKKYLMRWFQTTFLILSIYLLKIEIYRNKQTNNHARW